MNRFQQYANSQDDLLKTFYLDIIDSWDEKTLQRANELADRLEAAGCSSPEGWVISEIKENIPQSARYAFLKSIWDRVINHSVDNDFWLTGQENTAILEKVNSALTVEEKQTLYLEISKSLTFGIFDVIDAGCPGFDLPCWSLLELDENWKPTGRLIGGLHESLNDPEFIKER